MQDKSSAEMAVFAAEAPPCLPSTPSNSTDAAEYQNRTYPLPRGSKRQANSMSFIKLLTPMSVGIGVSISMNDIELVYLLLPRGRG